MAMHERDPVRRLWAHVIADALCGVYRRRRVSEADLVWLLDEGDDWVMPFSSLAAQFNIDAADVRADLRRDIAAGRITVPHANF